MLGEITPVILTLNEEMNLARTLSRLSWARDIVIVDSLSTDGTLEIAARHPAVRVFKRPFDSHAAQWNFAISETGIGTKWILALDADYVLSPDLVEELRGLDGDASCDAYSVEVRYCVHGIPLRGTLYPPVTALFRAGRGHYVQDGHTQRLQVSGRVKALKAKINHDDRKSLVQWLLAQDRYMRLEANYLLGANWSDLNFADKIRRLPPLAPFAGFAYCYFAKGLVLDGRPGLYYSLQRLFAEVILALRLIDRQLNGRS